MRHARDLLRDLAEVDRRIDNMRFLMGFQVEKRERILVGLRGAIGRTEPRTAPVDGPGHVAAGMCGLCGAEAAGERPARSARLVRTQDGACVVKDEDVTLMEMGVLTMGDGTTTETVAAGPACAARLGEGWWREGAPKDEA